jgi:hypothetical protein
MIEFNFPSATMALAFLKLRMGENCTALAQAHQQNHVNPTRTQANN